MSGSAFYDGDRIRQIATNLFYGWGYDFYRAENLLRSNDQLVRAQVCGLLSAARQGLHAAETAYRRVALPPLSREHPRPDPQAVATAQDLERLGAEIGAAEGAVRHLPVPETDRMTQRFRDEKETLVRLIAADEQLAGHAEALRATLAEADGATVAASVPAVRALLAALRAAIAARRDILGG